MFIKNSQTSVMDYLLHLMPELAVQKKDYVDINAAKKLFALWKNEEQKISKQTYKKPATLSINDVENMEKNGLVKNIGSDIEITAKGLEVLKIMILGNDKSIFEKHNDIVDYTKALAQVQHPMRTAKGKTNKIAQIEEDAWWDRLATKD